MEDMNVEELLELYYQRKHYYLEIIECREKLRALLNVSTLSRQEKNIFLNILSNLENEFRQNWETIITTARVIDDERINQIEL